MWSGVVPVAQQLRNKIWTPTHALLQRPRAPVTNGLAPGPLAAFGRGLIAFALLVYPAIGELLGHDHPATPTFGHPCPTTIFTIGMLMLMTHSSPRWLYIAPLLWTLVGSTAAFLLGVYQDLGLVVAGLAGAWVMSGARSPRPVERQLGR